MLNLLRGLFLKFKSSQIENEGGNFDSITLNNDKKPVLVGVKKDIKRGFF